MQKPTLIFKNIGELLTLEGAWQKQARHIREEDLSIIKGAAVACVDGRVAWVGTERNLPREFQGESVDLGGAVVLPGFVECHTHSVFAGNRAEEFEWRMQGQTYQEISAKGGGILSTVKATRQASAAELLSASQKRVDEFIRQGVTTVETKSGYGLDLDTEVKCLSVAAQLKGPRVIKTYLGAHSRSPDHADLNAYMDFMLKDVLPRVVREKLADRVDIYIEKGFYDLSLARAYLSKAKEMGLALTAHVEQLSDSGGTELALEFNPQSVDHVVYLSEQAIARVAKADTTAVLLPASDFYLKMRYPPARALLDQGARVAISTDYNPGTSPTQDLSLVGVLARVEMKMSLAECLCAYTLGAAFALGKSSEWGSLSIGKFCDFAVLDCSWRELFYSVGRHPVRASYVSGKPLKKDEKSF